MASAQQVHDASQLNHEEKAKVGKALEEAKNVLENNKASRNSQVYIVAAAMHNNQGEGIKNYANHSYNGDFLANPSKDIPAHGSGAFLHQLTHWDLQGPMGAVIYGHYDLKNPAPSGKPRLGWLLAWRKGLNGKDLPILTHKVYVKAGLLEDIQNLKWDEIAEKVNRSGMVSHYRDSATGAAVVAEIKDYGNDALVGANFDIKNELPPQAN